MNPPVNVIHNNSYSLSRELPSCVQCELSGMKQYNAIHTHMAFQQLGVSEFPLWQESLTAATQDGQAHCACNLPKPHPAQLHHCMCAASVL